jgi:hypothetical protein
MESASEFLSVFPSVLQSVFSCSPARNACHSHPSYIYHPLDICPSADCKYSLYAVQNADFTIKFSVSSVSLTASYSRNSLFLNKSSPRICPEPNVSVWSTPSHSVYLKHLLLSPFHVFSTRLRSPLTVITLLRPVQKN